MTPQLTRTKAFCSFSGGKDSCLALWKARAEGLDVSTLLVMMDESGERSRSHGLGSALLKRQADSLGARLVTGSAGWKNYEAVFLEILRVLRAEGHEVGVFGDIDLLAHRQWEEAVCAAVGLRAHLPPWQADRRGLAREMLQLGFRAVIVCVDSRFLDDSFAGHDYDAKFLADLVVRGDTMFKRIVWTIVVILLVLTAYLSLWPVPIHAVAWKAPVAPGYTGPHAVNDKLAGLTLIQLGTEAGPEHIVLARDGKLYAAMASGNVVRMNPDGSAQEVFANTGGRVLGFDFDAAGRLIAADAVKGLLAVDADRKVTLLTDKVGGDPIRYADAVVVAKTGKIYFSDASARFGPAQWGGTFEAAVLDIIEQASTGRILEYDPATKATRIVAKGLSFANGVALGSDEQTLFVAETGKYRVWKVSVAANDIDLSKGAPPPQASILFDNLPGYPDNLMRGQEGRIWLGFSGPRSPDVDAMAEMPFMRELTLRLPRALWPLPKRYGHVMAFSEDGKVNADLQDPSGVYPETTGATETADRLYVQNLHLHVLGWKPR